MNDRLKLLVNIGLGLALVATLFVPCLVVVSASDGPSLAVHHYLPVQTLAIVPCNILTIAYMVGLAAFLLCRFFVKNDKVRSVSALVVLTVCLALAIVACVAFSYPTGKCIASYCFVFGAIAFNYLGLLVNKLH